MGCTNRSFGTWVPARYTEVAFIQGWAVKRCSECQMFFVHCSNCLLDHWWACTRICTYSWFSTDFSSCTTVYCSCMSGHFLCTYTQWMPNVFIVPSLTENRQGARRTREAGPKVQRATDHSAGVTWMVDQGWGWGITLMCIVFTYKILYSR